MTPNTAKPSNYGAIKAITKRKGNRVLNAAAGAGHRVTRVYGAGGGDHQTGRCVDFMHYGNAAMRDWLVTYLRKNKAALGVMGIISNRRVMGFPSQGSHYRGPENRWRPYSGSDPHTDHVHVEFNAHGIGATTGANKPAAGRPKPSKLAKRGRVYIPAGKHKGTHKGITSVSVYWINKKRKSGGFSRHIYYVQRWLFELGYLSKAGAMTGYWSSGNTQAAYNKFRRAAGWKGADAKGTAGRQSLTQLAKAANLGTRAKR